MLLLHPFSLCYVTFAFWTAVPTYTWDRLSDVSSPAAPLILYLQPQLSGCHVLFYVTPSIRSWHTNVVRLGVGVCQLMWFAYRCLLFLFISLGKSFGSYQPSQSADLELDACLRCFCLSGFSAAAPADRGQDVVRTPGGWSRSQAAAWCWSSGLRSERSDIHRYIKTACLS